MGKPYFKNGKAVLFHGDCIDVLKTLPDNSVDACVTDPPYALVGNSRKGSPQPGDLNTPYGRSGPSKKKGFMGKEWDGEVPGVEIWQEVYRVLKPGAHLLSFGGTRTYHRLACAIEDAGFEIRDQIQWIYGSGFPKSLDVGKAIDKMGGNSIGWFIDYCLEVAEKKGITKKQLTGLFPSKSGKMTGWLYNKVHTQSLTVEQFNRLKDFLDLPFDDLESAEREIVGTGKAGLTKGNVLTFTGKTEFDLTAPATDQAQKWDGWGTALKPANEPICLARKPLIGTVAKNVTEFGTGALNIDGCRVDATDHPGIHDAGNSGSGRYGWNRGETKASPPVNRTPPGRWPANVILTHHPECNHVGTKEIKSKQLTAGRRTTKDGTGWGVDQGGDTYEKGTGAKFAANGKEQMDLFDCHPDCPIKILDGQSGVSKGTIRKPTGKKILNPDTGWNENNMIDKTIRGHLDKGGASRFFYCAKASRKEREAGLEHLREKLHGLSGDAQQAIREGKTEYKDGFNKIALVKNNHPTVKPIKLMEYLIRLVTPPDGIVLDPFCGSGTTLVAAKGLGFKSIGIEKEEEYCQIASGRIQSID